MSIEHADMWSALRTLVNPLGPLQLVYKQDGLHPWPIVTFVIVGALYWLRTSDKKSISAIQFIKQIFPPALYRDPTSRIGYWSYALNGIYAPILAIVALGVSAEGVRRQLITHLGEPIVVLPGGWAAVGFSFVVILLVFDFAAFFQHYLMHKVPFLWRLHRCHHSAEALTPFSAFRDHPLSHLFASVVVGWFSGVATGVVLYFTNMTVLDPRVLALLTIKASVLLTANYIFHGHMWISFGGLNYLFISPALHQIHHSALLEHRDKNMGSFLSIWDRMFGTLYVPASREIVPFGISDQECGPTNPHLTLWQYLVEPVTTSISCLLQMTGLKKEIGSR